MHFILSSIAKNTIDFCHRGNFNLFQIHISGYNYVAKCMNMRHHVL